MDNPPFDVDPFEPAMAALFAKLVAAAAIPFTADATEGDSVLIDVLQDGSLFVGLPVFGDGVASDATIVAIDADAGTVTLSDPLTASGSGVAFTTGFQTTGRRVVHWNAVSAVPAMFMRRTGTHDEFSGQMPIRTLEGEIWLYAKPGTDPDVPPDQLLGVLDQMMRSAFAPDVFSDFDRCTLDGLVYWARIEGKSDYADGAQLGTCIARIPFRITLP